MIVSQTISETGELNGAMLLFADSINGTTQDNLRMGYAASNGTLHIISVPVEKIIFNQKENVTPSGSFNFSDWDEEKTLQNNIDNHLVQIIINLTPGEFIKLIQ